jgi:NADH-quinone oxidoreductase subunit F
MSEPYLLPPRTLGTLSDHLENAGGDAISVARSLGPAAVRAVVDAAGLRGRDSAGAGVASRWGAIALGDDDAGPRYLVANGSDSEPYSFVDRALLRSNPYQVLEGLVIAALAVGAREAFVVIRRSFTFEYEVLTAALAEAELGGWFDDVSVKCVRAPEEYLVNDERCVLEVIEGRAPLPVRLAPAVDGLFSVHDRDSGVERVPARPNPTVVESVETLANLGPLVRRGAAWFRSMGTSVSPGHVLCTVTGDVRRHEVAEIELGQPLLEVLELVGDGFDGGVPPKAVLNGVSSPVLTRSRLAAPLSWEGLSAVGASLGRAAFHVLSDDTDMVAVAHRIAAFLYVESCGICPACKFGGGEVTAYLARLVSGVGSVSDVEALGSRLPLVPDGRRCDLPLRQRDVVSSILRAFPEDVMAAARAERSPPAQPEVLSRIVELTEGKAVWDTEQARKRADWVLEPQPVRLTRW